MKKLLVLLFACPVIAHAQMDIGAWIMNVNGKKGSYWAQTGTPGSPVFTFTVSGDSADILKLCYNTDTVWVRAQGLTDNMGKYQNPGTCEAQNYTFRFPRNPTAATTKVISPKMGAIGSLLNGVPIYGLSNSNSWSGTADMPGAGGLGIWNVEVGISEGFVLDTAFGAHPQQDGAYHSHTTPYRFYRSTPAGTHSPLVGYAFDGYPVYGPYGYSTATDPTSAVVRMKSGYSLRSITTRTTLPDGTALTSAQYGPAVSTTYPIGHYCEDYEWLASNGGDLDEYNGRFCKTPEYPGGTYAYFVTVDAAGAAVFPYYIGIYYYGVPDAGNFGMSSTISIPASVSTCQYPVTNGVEEVLASGKDFVIYPNPSRGNITLATNGGYNSMVICNTMGAQVFSKEINAQFTSMNLQLAPGMYFVKCTDSTTGESRTQSFVIK